jgi:hypothetical protein
MILYVAGPYSGGVTENIAKARAAAIELWQQGHGVLCPHLNTQHFEKDCSVSYQDYIRQDLRLLARCDAIVMLEGWEESNGARTEHSFAHGIGMPIYYFPVVPPPHPTEVSCPAQAEAFIATAMQMYRLHLRKNADYSPANILGTGEVGLVTRIWDKVARLMSLTGFKVEVTATHHAAPKKPQNESVEDTLLDLANYSIITHIFRKGLWGK